MRNATPYIGVEGFNPRSRKEHIITQVVVHLTRKQIIKWAQYIALRTGNAKWGHRGVLTDRAKAEYADLLNIIEEHRATNAETSSIAIPERLWKRAATYRLVHTRLYRIPEVRAVVGMSVHG